MKRSMRQKKSYIDEFLIESSKLNQSRRINFVPEVFSPVFCGIFLRRIKLDIQMTMQIRKLLKTTIPEHAQ